jgi:putative (di)nucleoside polyphosphate hydrolase
MLNRKGKLLVCERRNQKGAWQFPQGGVDKGGDVIEEGADIIREGVGGVLNLIPGLGPSGDDQ